MSRDIGEFAGRHLGPRPSDIHEMLGSLNQGSLDDLIAAAMPEAIRWSGTLDLPPARTEHEVIADLAEIAGKNQVTRAYLGMGYYGTLTPAVIQRQILENPGWYTQYTPYQAEISQGRLEMLLHFQTVVCDLTGMGVSNSSLLDEATAAAEAMVLCHRVIARARRKETRDRFFVAESCHPQTIEVIRTRAEPLGIEVEVGDPATVEFGAQHFAGILQYPASDGEIASPARFCERAHAAGALAIVASDLLALTLIEAPGQLGADVVVGSSQRFGVPLGYGGPHAAFLATRMEHVRQVPGRIIGMSKDARGKNALRMALQTREQHIRREKATSNICTAQVLLAIMAAGYAIYHGPEGLTEIARRIRELTTKLASGLSAAGNEVLTQVHFDTLRVRPSVPANDVLAAASKAGIELRDFDDGTIGISLDETVTDGDVTDVLALFGQSGNFATSAAPLPAGVARESDFLTHPTFHSYRSETELLRYLKRLESRDLSLTTSMIPLGSCTMKLNATAEMQAVSWPEFSGLHPFVPISRARGYQELMATLEHWLNEITGMAATSLQPNAGSQGEYTGLLVIRAHHRASGQEQRNVCLIPASAHGTNPASAKLAGMEVVVVRCDDHGNIDLADLEAKAAEYRDRVAALMVTYPSTHGVFEATIHEICDIVHRHGGQVYLDGANLNALVGLCRPREFGADVCHLNLHKTFCIPHGGGGPGMGPICVAEHLAPYLPGHPVIPVGGEHAIGAVSAAPWGSPSILPISYAYIAMMGPEGLTEATKVAILNANYIAKRLLGSYDVLYTGQNGLVAHECILDLRKFTKTAGIEAADVAKRLMDYGFHAPTLSFPVAGTLMVEPTESESKFELDRFCDAMLAIRSEIEEIEDGKADRTDNVLKNAPHTSEMVAGNDWPHGYSREKAAFPTAWQREHKYWPPVTRIDDVGGDRHLVCTCPPVE